MTSAFFRRASARLVRAKEDPSTLLADVALDLLGAFGGQPRALSIKPTAAFKLLLQADSLARKRLTASQSVISGADYSCGSKECQALNLLKAVCRLFSKPLLFKGACEGMFYGD